MEQCKEEHLVNHYILKEYLITKKLDEGSFGKIYIASFSKTGELFAVKLVITSY